MLHHEGTSAGSSRSRSAWGRYRETRPLSRLLDFSISHNLTSHCDSVFAAYLLDIIAGMVNRRPSDAAELAIPVAPVVKRKRRASCLGEQERRERKRAIDREAQRSLREKTKTHIAELERTIQILRDQDRNGATANLLSEIDSLRAENERLRDIIDSVRNVLGNESAQRTTTATEPPPANGGGAIASPASSSNGMHQLTQMALYDFASKRLTDR
jgi:hypothetical protein